MFTKPVFAADAGAFDFKPAGTNFAALGNLTIPNMVKAFINLSLIAVSLIFFFILIFGGIKWITSEGDEKKLTVARNQVTNALVGLVIVFAAWAIVALLQTVFGVSILNINIPVMEQVGVKVGA